MTDGVFLIGLGVFALLNASGRLPWSFWYDALSLWPILIVSGGLRIAVERSRTPWLALLGPAMVLTVLGVLATGRIDVVPGPWLPVAARQPEGAASYTLRVKMASARMDVHVKPLAEGTLLEGRQASRESKAKVEATKVEEGDAKLDLNIEMRGFTALLPGRNSRWEVDATNALPLKVEIDGAMIGARMDLTQGRLQHGTLRGAFKGLVLRLPRPREPVHLELHGAFNAIDLYVPAGTPVRVHGPGFPFNIVDRGSGDPKDAAHPGYEVHYSGVFSRVGVSQAN
jgi:hypothetical protein